MQNTHFFYSLTLTHAISQITGEARLLAWPTEGPVKNLLQAAGCENESQFNVQSNPIQGKTS